ncbi:hypothetical protein QCA50_011367 [Cerrena zonata]|uniref:Uncharacterized protein n=1 Tax=Cerrena zonata TaxID=2478898 RepID=A0AAW0G6B7_9APHY
MSSLLRFLPSRQKTEAQVSDSSSNVDVKEPVQVSEKDNEKYARTSKDDSSLGELYEVKDQDPDLNPGSLTLEEDAAGGMGRHLGVFSCTLLIVGRIIGTGIFSTPSSYPRFGWIGRCITYALGPWFYHVILWSLHLA